MHRKASSGCPTTPDNLVTLPPSTSGQSVWILQDQQLSTQVLFRAPERSSTCDKSSSRGESSLDLGAALCRRNCSGSEQMACYQQHTASTLAGLEQKTVPGSPAAALQLPQQWSRPTTQFTQAQGSQLPHYGHSSTAARPTVLGSETEWPYHQGVALPKAIVADRMGYLSSKA